MIIKKTTEGSEATLFLDGWLDTQDAPELKDELESRKFCSFKLNDPDAFFFSWNGEIRK